MNILVVGNGQHTKRKIIPALKVLKTIKNITVADRNSEIFELNNKKKINIVNTKFAKNKNLSYNCIIISTYPSSHIENILEFKNFGKNFIIEKPISNDIKYILSDKFKNLYDKLNIVESLMFFHHPLYGDLKKLIANNEYDSLEAKFTIPSLKDEQNFRYNKTLGGSAILDNGIYPISLISELAQYNLKLISKNVNYHKKYGIDKNGEAFFTSQQFKKINISWGMTGRYNNYVMLKRKEENILIPYFFSKPENTIPQIYLNDNLLKKTKNINQFRNLYKNFLNNEAEKFFYSSYSSLINRYKIIEMLLND